MFYLFRKCRFLATVSLFVVLSTVLTASAQSPGDCTICDPYLEANDLEGYGQCFAENCDSSIVIPVNGNIWVLMLAGLVLVVVSKEFSSKNKDA